MAWQFPLCDAVLTYPDSRLRRKSLPVAQEDLGDDLLRCTEHMFRVMDARDGCGLAAPQIGISLRVIVSDMVSFGGRRFVLINPEIVYRSQETCSVAEGCLSIPYVSVEVERAQDVRVRYLNDQFELVEEEWSAMPSINLQHEMDHLDGTLIIDYLPRVERERTKQQLRYQARKADAVGS